MTDKFLIILSPPRSFSSVVSTMVGQHPQLYGFPELHLFIGDTVQEVLDREYRAGNIFGPPGVLRTLAQLLFGYQTNATIIKSIGWLAERRHWSTKRLMDFLLDQVDPLIGMEKSPVTAMHALWIERTYAFYPNAYYLHLTRHPVATRKSMDEFIARRQQIRQRKHLHHWRDGRPYDSLFMWYRFHKNILDFTRTLPTAQTMRIKGEDVLSDPDLYLPQICEWLGIRSDREAIASMKHPELSPYAYRGPSLAAGGNDGNFMQSPALRAGRIKVPSLAAMLQQEPPSWVSADERERLQLAGYQLAPSASIIEKLTGLAQSLGYL